jgi:hypothetical protein
VFIDDDGDSVVMDGVDCTGGDADSKVGISVLGFVIVPIEPFPLDIVGVLHIDLFPVDVVGGVALEGGEAIKEGGTIPFEDCIGEPLDNGDFPLGIPGEGIIGALKGGDLAIP